MCIFTKKFRTLDPHPPIVKDFFLKKFFLDAFPYQRKGTLRIVPNPITDANTGVEHKTLGGKVRNMGLPKSIGRTRDCIAPH